MKSLRLLVKLQAPLNLERIISSLNEKDYCQQHQSAIKSIPISKVEQKLIDSYKPERVFVVYGSLAPGRPNYHKLQDIAGRWSKAVIYGQLVRQGWGADLGYYGLKKDSHEKTEIAVFIFVSDYLIRYWPALDEFEGEDYERILIAYKLETGETGVGNIYVLKE